jgi:hypothetical protein
MFSLLIAVAADGVGFFHLATIAALDEFRKYEFDARPSFALSSGRPFAFW